MTEFGKNHEHSVILTFTFAYRKITSNHLNLKKSRTVAQTFYDHE